jgi:hypothetical protein
VKRIALAVVVALAACSDLRSASRPEDASPGDAGGEPDADGLDAASAEGGDDGAPEAGKDATSDASGDAPAEAATSCDGGCTPEVLGSGFKQPTIVVVDGQNVYFEEEGTVTGAVYECPKTGCGGAPTLLGPGQTTGIALDATRVYWGDFQNGKIVACDKGGCAGVPTVLAGAEPYASGLTTDGSSLYWVTSNTTVRTCALPACAGPSNVTTGTLATYELAALQGSVFWADNGTQSIVECPGSGCVGAPVKYANGIASGLSSAAGFLYWVSGSSRTVVSCPAVGCGTPSTIGSSTSPAWPVSDGLWIYFRDTSLDAIYKCPIGGCGPGATQIAANERNDSLGRMAVDATHLYWADQDGTIKRMPR